MISLSSSGPKLRLRPAAPPGAELPPPSKGRGGTQLYDAIFLAADELMKHKDGRKALVVFSDGVDRGSKDTMNDAVDAADRANVQIFTIYFKGEEDKSSNFGFPGNNRRGGMGYPGGGYPGGGQSGGQGQGRGEEANKPAPADDVEFLNQMLDEMAAKFSVDASRVYATGLSEGGFMAMRVGCAMADRIAAIAPVGAAMPKTMICLPSRPVPVVMINGTSDPVVPHGGGTEHNLQLPVISVEDSAKAWARIDRCSEKPTQTKLPAHEKGGMETKVETYDACQQSAQVISYSVKGAGNTWPGGEQYQVEKQVGKTSQDLSANETIWSFLVSKKLAPKSATNNAQ